MREALVGNWKRQRHKIMLFYHDATVRPSGAKLSSSKRSVPPKKIHEHSGSSKITKKAPESGVGPFTEVKGLDFGAGPPAESPDSASPPNHGTKQLHKSGMETTKHLMLILFTCETACRCSPKIHAASSLVDRSWRPAGCARSGFSEMRCHIIHRKTTRGTKSGQFQFLGRAALQSLLLWFWLFFNLQPMDHSSGLRPKNEMQNSWETSLWEQISLLGFVCTWPGWQNFLIWTKHRSHSVGNLGTNSYFLPASI